MKGIKNILRIFSAVVLAMMISNTSYGLLSEESLKNVRAWKAKLRADAEQGDADAQYSLGITYWGFSPSVENQRKAVEWYRKAAEQGHVHAQKHLVDALYSLGSAYGLGFEVEKDQREAVRWYQMAAEQGHANAQDDLGDAYYFGWGVDLDRREAVRWYRKAAEQGIAGAQFNLGNAYWDGEGVEKDQREAIRWFRMAAEQGDAWAQYNLGVTYNIGEGVKKDQREAVRWFRKAAEQGLTKAQYALGYAYDYGEGVKKDQREAVRWYRKAAEQDDAWAQTHLGYAYWNGKGVDKDQREAVKWFRKAAEQGLAEAQFGLGYAYRSGEGVEKDQREGVRWYRKAAEQGNAKAQNDLGSAYWQGEGVITDKREAYIWWSIAKVNGSETAADILSTVNWDDHLSKSEIRSANKEAARRMEAIENREAETVEKPSISENIALAKPSGGVSIAEKVFENAWRSVVIVTTDDGQGSGVIIRPNVVATNCHVVDDGGEIIVYKSDNRRADTDTPFAATIRRANAEDDFCLLDVAGLWGVPATVRRYDTLKVGEAVYGLGAPKGLDLSLSDGLVSQLREVRGTRFIQTNAAISPGSSGGGLFDSEGNLVGIMTLKIADESVEGIGFAIAADLALE